jgi:hypothetical protein
MRQKIYSLILTGVLVFGFQGLLFSQELSATTIDKIEREISKIFEKSIEAGERLDVNGISKNINDSLKTGFIDNGHYFRSFEDLMVGFKSAIQGIEYQKMNVDTQKITVLSPNYVLLTVHGGYSAKVIDGRILNGKFAWTFVYSNINGDWKVIHSHMSNPKS